MDAAKFDRRTPPPGARFTIWPAGDGWPLRRMDWSQEPGREARGSIFFAGGRSDFIEKYLEPIGHWHARGWNVASFDWRGQGESRRANVGGHLDSFDPLVGDCAALLERWVAETPPPHVAIAHSMGGHLLLRTIAEHRPTLAATVLVSPMIGLNAAPIPPWLGRIIAAFLAGIGCDRCRAWKRNERPSLSSRRRRQAYLTSSLERYADEEWWQAQRPGFDLGPPTWGWLDAAYRSVARLSPGVLRSVEMPILIIGTDSDRLVSAHAIRRAARQLPDAELLMFPHAGHEILRESDPIRLAALARIDSFLDRTARA